MRRSIRVNATTTPSLPTQALADARAMFDYYLRLTAEAPFKRTESRPGGGFLYPIESVQADMAAFAGVFSCVWQAIASRPVFTHYYAAKPDAFIELRKIVTGNDDGYAQQARFWIQDAAGSDVVPCDPATLDCMWSLGRTFRNGLNHFQFRYIHTSPDDYFDRLGHPMPTAMKAVSRQPSSPDNYRIFIFDFTPSVGCLQPGSNTRIIETLLAHLRYHLFCFLGRFFTEPNDSPYTDILTRRPLEAPPQIATTSAPCVPSCKGP
jgi:hypothetical protein